MVDVVLVLSSCRQGKNLKPKGKWAEQKKYKNNLIHKNPFYSLLDCVLHVFVEGSSVALCSGRKLPTFVFMAWLPHRFLFDLGIFCDLCLCVCVCVGVCTRLCELEQMTLAFLGPNSDPNWLLDGKSHVGTIAPQPLCFPPSTPPSSLLQRFLRARHG